MKYLTLAAVAALMAFAPVQAAEKPATTAAAQQNVVAGETLSDVDCKRELAKCDAKTGSDKADCMSKLAEKNCKPAQSM